MAYARGPIKNTCPDIDRQQNWNAPVIVELKNAISRYDEHSIKDLVSTMESALDRLKEMDDFLEEMRSANDALRTWGAEMEDKAEQFENEVISLQRELSSHPA